MTNSVGKIPGREAELVPFVQEIIAECYVSLERRRDMYRYFRQFYYTGSSDGGGSKHNKCFSHIDKLSSLLFSPSEVKFDISFDGDEVGPFAEMGDTAARYLTKEYYRSKSGIVFGQAVEVALVEQCAFTRKVWGHHGAESYVIRPQFMGVLREDIADLDKQDAFVNSFYVTPRGLRRLLANRADRDAIVDRVKAEATKPAQTDTDGDYFHEIVMGGLQPITTTGTPSGQKGSVSLYAMPQPMMAPEIATSLIRIDEAWIMDDEREDWTTIRYVDPGIILEGADRHRNLSDIPHEQPFTKVCPNEVPGYFWGMSELATVSNLQELLTARLNDADNIIKRQSRPSRVFSGFSSINPERAAALMSLDGILSDDSMQTKIETLAPTMPPDMLRWIEAIETWFDDQAGITPIMQGQGEQGVRSGNHAGALMRTSTPRLRDRAMLVETQCATDGDLHLKMLQAKDARVFTVPGTGAAAGTGGQGGGGGLGGILAKILGAGGAPAPQSQQFLLAQLPDDATVMVDSHSSSPAFSGDQMNNAYNLKRFGAIDNEDLIDMIPGLPRASELKLKARKREQQESAFLAQHPELLAKGGAKGGRR